MCSICMYYIQWHSSQYCPEHPSEPLLLCYNEEPVNWNTNSNTDLQKGIEQDMRAALGLIEQRESSTRVYSPRMQVGKKLPPASRVSSPWNIAHSRCLTIHKEAHVIWEPLSDPKAWHDYCKGRSGFLYRKGTQLYNRGTQNICIIHYVSGVRRAT